MKVEQKSRNKLCVDRRRSRSQSFAKYEEIKIGNGKETHTELVHGHQPRGVNRGATGGQLGLPPLERGAAPSAGHANDRGVEDGGGGAARRGHGCREPFAVV